MRLSRGPVRPRTRAVEKAWRYTLMVLLSAILSQIVPSQAIANETEVQTVWRLLDYIAVDYAGAVSDGRVTSEAEYAEMLEFAGQVEARLRSLPEKGGKAGLVRQTRVLRQAIAAKAPPAEVATQSKALASALLAAYPVPLAPTVPPDLARGAALYAQNCASCHGANGDGHGPASAG
ncbi:MAG TPA: cytochrome c, partial [Methylocella sp.]|nr:cytochrome c [Methylocella sp.]